MKNFNTDALKGLIYKYDGRRKIGLSLRDYLDEKARCGCGFDCCDNTLHWIDRTTGVHYVEYYSEGIRVSETYESYRNTGVDVIPDCTYVMVPVEGDTGTIITDAITWTAASNATGYKISIGTTTGGTEHTNAYDVGNVLTVTPGTTAGISILVANTEYFVTIIPYSLSGDKTACTEVSFTTLEAPAATTLTTPADGATGVVLNSDVVWGAAARATGYKVTIGSATGLTDIANAADVGNVTTVTPGTTAGIPAQTAATQYFWTITAYNSSGETVGAESEFTIAI